MLIWEHSSNINLLKVFKVWITCQKEMFSGQERIKLITDIIFFMIRILERGFTVYCVNNLKLWTYTNV